MVQLGRFVGFFKDLFFSRVISTCTSLSAGVSIVLIFFYSVIYPDVSIPGNQSGAVDLKSEQVQLFGSRLYCPASVCINSLVPIALSVPALKESLVVDALTKYINVLYVKLSHLIGLKHLYIFFSVLIPCVI